MNERLVDVAELLAEEDLGRVVVVGNDRMTLEAVCTTRCVEIVLHTLDLVAATSMSCPLDAGALEIVRRYVKVADNGAGLDSTGALNAVPGDLEEAAMTEGATPQWIRGTTSRQAHADLPPGTVEEEHGREGFTGRASHLYRLHAPTGWRSLSGPLRPHALDTGASSSTRRTTSR